MSEGLLLISSAVPGLFGVLNRNLRLQSDLLLLILGNLLLQHGPVVRAVVGVVPRILVGHVELLEAVNEVVLSFSHVPLEVVIQLLLLLELRLELLLLEVELVLLLSQGPVLLLGLFELLFGLQSLLDLVLEVVLGLDELSLGEVHHLALQPPEEPGCGKLGLDRLCLRL